MGSRTNGPRYSLVEEHPAAEPSAARAHLQSKLAHETDPFDVKTDLERGRGGIVVVDTRSAKAWQECRIPGAVSLPHRRITAGTTADIPKDAVVVTYCWGPACNASTKGAARLAALGFRVKEMIGGIEYWREEGFEVEGTLGVEAPLYV